MESMNPIVLAIVVLVVLGLAGGVILVLASKFMAVYEDPRIAQITECLAGAICGGCGYAGCADYAKAIAYSPYISEVNGDNREAYRKLIVQLCRKISSQLSIVNPTGGQMPPLSSTVN